MRSIPWATATRVSAALVTAFFVAGTVLQALIVFELLGARPGGGVDFIDEVFAGFEWEYERWPVEFAATALFGLGFLALGALGTLLAGLAARGDARRDLVRAAFIGAAGLGLGAELLWLGVKPIVTNPVLCECGLRQEEIISRMWLLNVGGDVQVWLLLGSVLLLSIGSVLIGPVGSGAGLPMAWAWLAPLIAVLGIVAAVLHVLQLYPIDLAFLFVVAGIIVPIWALMVAVRAPEIAAPSEGA